MGTKIFDIFTLGHFFCGVIITSTLLPNTPILSLIIANLAHFILELSEKNINPYNGKILETTSNHLSDIVAFFTGSLIGLFLTNYMVENSSTRYIILTIGVIIGIQEFGRELFPKSCPFNPSYS